MADEFQGIDVVAKPFPFAQPDTFRETDVTGLPWGQALVHEVFDTQVIGVGDTGTINFDISLPVNYVAILRSMNLCITDSADIDWDRGVIGLAYQSPGGPPKESVATFPEDEYLWWQLNAGALAVRDRFSTNQYYLRYSLGQWQTSSSFVHQSQPEQITQVPLWIYPQADTNLNARAVIIYLKNDSASQPAQGGVLEMAFDLYTFEQAYHSFVMSSPRTFP